MCSVIINPYNEINTAVMEHQVSCLFSGSSRGERSRIKTGIYSFA